MPAPSTAPVRWSPLSVSAPTIRSTPMPGRSRPSRGFGGVPHLTGGFHSHPLIRTDNAVGEMLGSSHLGGFS
jgi:hypothetical protein